MKRTVLTRLKCLLMWCGCGAVAAGAPAQQVGRTAIEIQVPQPPTPATALGRTHLVYELHVTNFGGLPATLEQIDVLDGGRAPIASWTGPQLWQRVRLVGHAGAAATTTGTLQPGARGITYLWITLQPGVATPSAIVHRVTVSHGAGERDTITTSPMSLPPAAPMFAAPVRGGPWVALRGPSNTSGHRLALVALDGRARVPQRFAVDWALLGDDGLPFRGDRTDITNWYGYGAPVYAAAGGTVALVRDGSADHPAFTGTPPDAIDPADAAGNVVVIDIGQGRFVTYAHLKAGSLLVASGDRVVAGQSLAQIGNSGNTLGPHLHFQVSDAVEPLGGEGLPFALQAFELVGRIASLPALLDGGAWQSNAAQPARKVTGEMPLENMVVRFEIAAPLAVR